MSFYKRFYKRFYNFYKMHLADIKYYYDNSIAFNTILGKKKSSFNFLWRLLFFPIRSFLETSSILKYGRENGYSVHQIFSEMIIAISSRFSALLGEIYGNK